MGTALLTVRMLLIKFSEQKQELQKLLLPYSLFVVQGKHLLITKWDKKPHVCTQPSKE